MPWSRHGLLAASLLLVLTPALCLAQNKCAGEKIKATGKKASCKAGLEAKQASAGGTIDPAKVAKCEAKLSSTFAKNEAKGGCTTTGDAAAAEAKVDAFVADLDAELAVGTPSKCQGEKIKAAGKKAACKLALEAKQAAKGGTIDPAKVAKCESKFSSTFAKNEANGGCNTTGDTAAVEAKVDAFMTDVDSELSASPTTTTSTTTTPTTTTTTTTLPPPPSCDEAGTVCGFCPGSGVCQTHCGAPGNPLVCLNQFPDTYVYCTSDADCAFPTPFCGGLDHYEAGCQGDEYCQAPCDQDECSDGDCDFYYENPCTCPADCPNDPDACEPCECGSDSANCWCDPDCVSNGDCCASACAVCGACP